MTTGKKKRKLISLFLAAALVVGLGAVAFAATTLYDNRYTISETQYTLAPGITEYVTITNNRNATDQNIDYFCEVDPEETTAMLMSCYPDYDGSKFKMENVLDQAADAQASFDSRNLGYRVVGIINADYYNMTTGEPIGALAMEGKVYHETGGNPYFAILKNGTAVIRDGSVSMDDVESAVGGSPILVKNGEIVVPNVDDTKFSRSAVGIKADGTVVTMVNHGKNYPVSCGYTSYQMAQMMKARGCVDVLLLDGSGSSSHATLRAGDSGILMRNEPSDGSPRHISSSILLVTKATPTGEFAKAEISPTNEVYTPGSTVNFTYVAVDSSNAAVEEDKIPQLTWKLTGDSKGSITQQGVFTADETQTGNVTVQLVDANELVYGESTILVQNPDSISFKSETVSLGLGDTSDLGLTVRYEGRDVHYKDGDFEWKIQPTEYTRKHRLDDKPIYNTDKVLIGHEYETLTVTDQGEMKDLELGTVSDNKLTCVLRYTPGTDETEKRVPTAKATVTVTSKANSSVSGSVTVEAGKEPSVIMDFEDRVNSDGTTTSAKDFWSIGQLGDNSGSYLVTSNYDRGGTVGAEIVSRADGYPVRSGSYSLKLDYSFHDPRYGEYGVSGTEGACFGFRDELKIEGNPTAIGVWVYVPEGTPNYWLRLRYQDGSGRVTQLDFTKQYKDAMAQDKNVGGVAPYADGTWHYFKADLSGLQAPLSIPSGMIGRLMVVRDDDNFCGRYLIDGSIVPAAEREGSIYFDDIMFIYGSNPSDTNLPEVTSFTVNDTNITDGMKLTTNELNFKAEYKDGDTIQDLGIDYNNVFLYVDGNRQDAIVDHGGNYIRKDSVILADGWHSVKLVVTDLNGNERVLNYRFEVDGKSDATSVYLKSDEEPLLGQSFDLKLCSTQVSDISEVTLSLTVDKVYKNKFTITPAAGFALDGEATYNSVNHTIDFTLKSDSGTKTSGDGVLATLTFNIPADLQEGTGFSYSVAKGSIVYVTGYAGNNIGAFGSKNVRFDIDVSCQITSDVFAAGLKNTYFYIKNSEGNPLSGVELHVKGSETLIGTSDSDGKILYEPETAGTVAVQASGSFPYTVTVNELPGNGTPDMIIHSAVGDITTQRVISWTTNPAQSASEAQIVLATDENMSDSSIYESSYTSGSELIEFSGDQKVVRANWVKVTDLTPGKTYYYKVGDGTTFSEVRSFTMPATGEKPKKILVMGDIQSSENQTPQALLNTLSDKAGYDLLIQTGDLVDSGNSYAKRKAAYTQLQQMGDVDRIYALGNHEKEGDGGVNSHILSQTGENGYYSVSLGDLYIAVIDYGSVNKESLEWMVQDANKSDSRWKFLVTHQPAYYTNSAGGNATIHDLVPQYAEEAGINLVLSGHDHSYARTKPLTDGEVNEAGGVTYLICGAVGEKGYDVSSNLPFADKFEIVKDNDDFNAIYLSMQVGQNGVQVDAYDYTPSSGSNKLDSFSLSCTHDSYVYDAVNKKLVCASCDAQRSDAYTGFVPVKDSEANEQVSFYLGNLRTGWFSEGDQWYHAGDDGILHDVDTQVTATCTEYGYRVGVCTTCKNEGKSEDVYQHQGSRLNPQGHKWNDNHICSVCGFEGIDIATLDIKLAYDSVPWTGNKRWPVVTVKDGDRELTRALSIGSGVGEYYLTYPNVTDVGLASLEVKAMDASNYYGSVIKTYKIVPPQVQNLEIEAFDENSVTLKWDAAHGATYYKISYYNEEKDAYYFRWQTEDTTFTIDGLETGKNYSYRVRAYAEIDGEQYVGWSSSNAAYVTPGTSDSCEANGHQYEATEIAASCEFGGGVRYTCSACGSSYTEISTSALGHKATVIPGVAATCTEAGISDGSKCSVCGEILTVQQDVAPLGHKLTQAEPVDDSNHSGNCSRCGEIITAAHSWDSGVVTKEATYEATGEKLFTCEVCGKTKTQVIAKLKHSSGSSSGGTTTYGD